MSYCAIYQYVDICWQPCHCVSLHHLFSSSCVQGVRYWQRWKDFKGRPQICQLMKCCWDCHLRCMDSAYTSLIPRRAGNEASVHFVWTTPHRWCRARLCNKQTGICISLGDQSMEVGACTWLTAFDSSGTCLVWLPLGLTCHAQTISGLTSGKHWADGDMKNKMRSFNQDHS